MNGIVTIVKICAFILVLGILGALVYFVEKFREDFSDPAKVTEKPLEEVIEDNDRIGFEPGQYEFNQALEMIALNEIDEAREKLNLIENLFPDSIHAPEARRILGEINLDEVLSVENMENKKIHRVSPGEGYLRIATENETTLDSIMFLNGLTEFGNLHAGDELVVMPLDFKLVINLPKKRVELYHRDQEKKEHVFAKDYPILKMNIGRLRAGPSQSKISQKFGEADGRSFPPTHESYRHATKVLGLNVGNTYLPLRPTPPENAPDPGAGIFLAPADMEELSMLIRVGNEVEVKSAG